MGAAGWIVPLTGLPKVDEYMADLPQGIIEQMSFEGEVYGLPYYSGNSVFVYNERILKQAGINAPPKTWDELMDQAKTIKQKGFLSIRLFLVLLPMKTRSLEI